MNLSATALQKHLIAIRSNKIFEAITIGVIVLSALVIGAKTYEIKSWWVEMMEILDFSITVYFVVEITIRMAAEKRFFNFFRNGWNIFDFLIVTVSLIPVDESQMALLARLLRIFRVLRLVAIIPELQILLGSLLKAIPRMGYVTLLMFIIFYIFGAIGSFLFEDINPFLWGNISISMLTLFRVSTFEDWTDVMYETMEVYPLSWIFYLLFIFLASFVFLNMMIGVVLDVMQSEHDKFNQEHGEGEAGEVHWIREHTQTIEARLARIETLLEDAHKKDR